MVTLETRRSLRNQGNKAQGQKGQIGTPESKAPQQVHQSQGRDRGMGGGGGPGSRRGLLMGGNEKTGAFAGRLSDPAAFFFLGGVGFVLKITL